MLDKMQKFLIKNIAEMEFEYNLGEPHEQFYFYCALKNMLDGLELNFEEQNHLGNIIYRQYLNPEVALKGEKLNDAEKKEASLVFQIYLLRCLLQQFNNPESIIQFVFDIDWFKQQRERLTQVAQTKPPFQFEFNKSYPHKGKIYILMLIVAALISLYPVNYYGQNKKALRELGIAKEDLVNYSFIAFVLLFAGFFGLKEGVSYYQQSNTFFKEQKSVAADFDSLIGEINNLIEYNQYNHLKPGPIR
ncbi:Uncharacterised protein [Legionella busanensis]|uniref:Uncharacterized protein n=1 Tax=Legionella busanensis TaxID=190655 RepID=A0A378KB15_9GAMM|nr:hypothetical protein [Legionella busanensis]STX81373.1 Uncharacterised protein [Legionella busanensis]